MNYKKLDYTPPFLLSNGHLLSIYPSLIRKLPKPDYKRERIATPDDDFIDIDWSRIGARRAVVISHGLEGDTNRSYVIGMVRALNKAGWDAAAWNFRGCSGETNRKLYFYHSGRWPDVHTVSQHVLGTGNYDQLALIGFSMGGNMSLMYLGQKEVPLDKRICGCVAFSVPCDLATSAVELAKWQNKIYMRRFLKMLHQKIKEKMKIFPGEIDDADFHKIKSFGDFDGRYVAPMWGFRDAADYWRQASSKPYLPHITTPTLLVNAKDDPFLSPECFPVKEAQLNPSFVLQSPRHGGHVGFVQFNNEKEYWSEKQAVAFLNSVAK
ncbi:MAG: alpha/beta fold hydrolase [Calditrichaeota bacterium]|nr:MAG: alpha/beta fold hydrolase [Calditrichota bacterium]